MTPMQVVESPDSDLLSADAAEHSAHHSAHRANCCVSPAQGHSEPSWLQRGAHGAIVFYQRAREGRPSPCRFFPSCSAYALEAIDVHGTWRGGWLASRRLLRCRPLGPSGFDPVPLRDAATPTAACDCDSAATLSFPSSPLSPLTEQKGG